MDHRCVFCLLRSYENYIEKLDINEEKRKIMAKEYIRNLGEMDFSSCAPLITQEMNKRMAGFNNGPDPYDLVKKESNELIMGMLPELRKRVEKSEDSFNTALKLAIAGNIIDYGAFTSFNVSETIERVLNSDFAIDHSAQLKEAINTANTILYLGDNAGEIVLDKLFLETVKHPDVYFAVRGGPVINDVTMEDAEIVGIKNVAKIVSNGNDAPSTILEASSKEFVELFDRADLIISKGQGNFEGLLNNNRKELFFLLMVKCDYIAENLGVKKYDFVVKMNI